MSRTRIVLTLVFVACLAMLAGLLLSDYIARRIAPPPNQSRPEATEPHRSPDIVANV
jgi:hypothetical protein